MKYSVRVFGFLGLVALLLVGCDSDKKDADKVSHEPAVEAFLPAGLDALVLGVSTENEVLAIVGQPSRRDADHDLGGSMMVQRNGYPAINLVYMSGPHLTETLKMDGVADDVIETRLASDTLLSDREPLSRYSKIEASLVKAGAGDPLLTWLTVFGPQGSLCIDLGARLAKEPEASKCPGSNRKLGSDGLGWTYCGGNRDGSQNVMIDCIGRNGLDELSYWIMED